MIAAFVLTVLLQTPHGRVERFDYPPVTAAQCGRMLAADVAAADQNGYKLVSAKCEPVARKAAK